MKIPQVSVYYTNINPFLCPNRTNLWPIHDMNSMLLCNHDEGLVHLQREQSYGSYWRVGIGLVKADDQLFCLSYTSHKLMCLLVRKKVSWGVQRGSFPLSAVILLESSQKQLHLRTLQQDFIKAKCIQPTERPYWTTVVIGGHQWQLSLPVPSLLYNPLSSPLLLNRLPQRWSHHHRLIVQSSQAGSNIKESPVIIM